MAMRVMNNNSAMMALGELKKNDKSLTKQLKKVATGTKITGAGDGASEYAISEKMRVRIRALGQDANNVQTGQSLLHVAEGGIQNQIDIMKTIKEKVIDANNDSNSEIDRATIQKEIDQAYDQIESIAVDTDYNRRRVLFGGTKYDTVAIWEVMDEAIQVPDSDKMSVVPDKYPTLDGEKGPFDIFQEVTTKDSSMSTLGLAASQNYSGAQPGTPDVYHLDFSGYSSVDQLDGVGINFRNYWYVLTKTPNKNYRFTNGSSVDGKIDISSCVTVGDVVKKLADYSVAYGDGTADGLSLTYTTTEKSASANGWDIGGFSSPGETIKGTTTTVTERPQTTETGFFNPPKHLTGGQDQIGSPNNPDPDAGYQPAKYSSLTVNMNGVQDGTGITLSGYGTGYIKFVSGSGSFQWNADQGYYTVGIDGSASTNIAGMNVSYNHGTITFTSQWAGSSYDNYSISDGIPSRQASTTTTPDITYEPVTAFSGTVTDDKTGANGTPATFTIDLSGVPDTTSLDDLEKVIADMRGKILSWDGGSLELIDSTDTTSLASRAVSSNALDLNVLRDQIGGKDNKTVRAALSALLLAHTNHSAAASDGSGNIVLTSQYLGETGNSRTVTVTESTYRSYDLDYGKWFQDNPGALIPDDLYGKGFHFYCATDASQWFNVAFTDGNPEDKDRPKSGTDTQDIKTLQVDVSQVKNASDLVTAIYEQTMPLLTGPDPDFNHHYRMAAEPSTGVLTIYDERRYNVSDRRVYDYQEKGAKIADGVMDNVIKTEKDMLVDRLIIQHTDKANQNITLNIPRTTLDHIFRFIGGKHGISDYNVMTREMRDRLLGRPPEEGILDRGIRYLTDANAVIIMGQLSRPL